MAIYLTGRLISGQLDYNTGDAVDVKRDLNISLSDVGGVEDLVYTTGNQNISGIKDFYERLTVNGVGVLLSGEVSTSISGTAYSAQVEAVNDELFTIYKGQPVYIKGSNGTNLTVGLASNTGESTSSKTLGLVLSSALNHNTKGIIITEGLLSNFDVGTANAGDPIWLGPNGDLIYGLAQKPYAPNHLVYLGVVTRENNNGEIFVKVQNGYELDELHDVDVENSPTGQFLFKNIENQWSGKYLQISDVSGLGSSLSQKQITGDYYLNSNPSGYITTSQTGAFYPASNPSGFVTTATITGEYVGNITNNITGATKINNMMQITQAGYNAITPVANTLYIIVG